MLDCSSNETTVELFKFLWLKVAYKNCTVCKKGILRSTHFRHNQRRCWIRKKLPDGRDSGHETWSKEFSQRVGAWPVQEHLPKSSIPGEEAFRVYVQKDFRVALTHVYFLFPNGSVFSGYPVSIPLLNFGSICVERLIIYTFFNP